VGFIALDADHRTAKTVNGKEIGDISHQGEPFSINLGMIIELEIVCPPHSNSGYSVQESNYQCVLKSNQQAYLVIQEIEKMDEELHYNVSAIYYGL